ncbi:MAG: glycosyltransferase, partial [Parafannyhessea sp.]|uniref:glycosyltransferase n=1 Tax=Parafannyhessea sp. TaxID=2847324 RepID=UPI003F0E5D16
WLRKNAQFSWRVTVADNASTDDTLAIARKMSDQDPIHVGAIHLDEKGRGRALKRVWLASDARVVAYMDVDLSTDLDAIPALVTPLLAGSADVAYGSRLSRGSHTTRCLKREFISRCYNLLLNLAFSYHVADAQCGFKAMRAQAARAFLPIVQDNEWFFDTELLVVSRQASLTLREVPVTWVEDTNTTVDIPKTVRQDLAGIRRLRAAIRTHRLDTQIASVQPRAAHSRNARDAASWQDAAQARQMVALHPCGRGHA